MGDWAAASALAEKLPAYSRAHDKLILAAALQGDHRRVEHLTAAFNTADISKSPRFKLSFETTEAIIWMHLHASDFRTAEGVYRSTLQFRSKFSASLYNQLILRYLQYNDLLRAEDTYEEMRLHSVLPDLETCAIVILLHGRLGRTARAQRIFAETISRGFRPDAPCYNALIEALLDGQMVIEARACFEELKASETVQPNPESILLLIRLLGREGDPDSAYQVFEDMQLKYGFERTIGHFNELLAAYAYNDRPDSVESVLFSGQGIEADEATYVTLLNMLIYRGQYDRAQRIFTFLRNRHSSAGFSFEKSAALLNVHLAMLIQVDNYQAAEYLYETEARALVAPSSTVSGSGMTPVVADADTYALMVECYAYQSQVDEALKVYELFKEAIRARRRIPDCFALSLLVHLLGRSGRIADALSVWNDLTSDSYRLRPDNLAYTVMLEACARNGAISHAVPIAERAIEAAAKGHVVLRADFAEACKMISKPRVSAKFQHRDQIQTSLRSRHSKFQLHPSLSLEPESNPPLAPPILEGLRKIILSLRNLPEKNS